MDVYVQLLSSSLANGCVYSLVALGFVLIFKTTGVINFAQGEVTMVGAYLAFTMIALFGMPYWAGVPVAVACGALFGAALERIVLSKARGRPEHAVIMLTIGMAYVIRMVVALIPGWGTQQKAFKTPIDDRLVHLGPVTVSAQHVSIVAATLGLVALLFAFFQYTKLGTAMRATAQNREAAYLMGVPVPLVYALIWGVSAGVATVAGILVAPITLIDIGMSNIGLRAFPAAVLGGFGSIPGAIIGGILIGFVETFAGFLLPDGYKDAMPFVVLLLVLMVKPSGLLGGSTRRKV